MKTKRFLSLALALIMVLGSFGMVSADTAVTTQASANPYERIVESGIFVGDNGDLMLDKTFNRAEFAAVALRLKGEGFTDEETVALNISSSFTDVDSNEWYAPYIGRAQQEGLVEGDLNKYLPGDDVSYVETLTILMRALGYVDNVDLVNYPSGYYAKAAQIGLADATIDADAKIKREVIADTLEVALDLELNGSDVTLAQELGIEELVVVPDALEVVDVKANSAKGFLVTFNKAVEDTDEIEFSVKRGSVATTITVKWNDDKTEATLAVANNLAQGIYNITVTDKSEEEAVELAKVDREIEKEKIVSVDFDSDTILRISETKGVVGFTVRNQYGDDITDAPLGRGLTWIVSTEEQTPTVDNKAGMITVKHGEDGVYNMNQLQNLQTVVITAQDITTGFVKTVSFGVSKTVSVVNDIKLLGIIDEKGNDADFVFNPTQIYYLDYEALDPNGNKVDYYAVLNSKVYGSDVLSMRVSSNHAEVKLEKHPETGKAVYRINFLGTEGPDYDMPVSFIATAPFSGKTSTYNTTLLRKARVETFSMQSPVETASVNKSVEIPFTALDGDGKEITNFEALDGKIIFSPSSNLEFVRQPDGSAKLFARFGSKGIKYITATVKGSLTGAFSQMSFDVKDAAIAKTIESFRLTRAFTNYKGATSSQSIKLSDLTVKDQFDRSMNLQTDGSGYRVLVTSLQSLNVKVEAAKNNPIPVANGFILAGNTDQEVKFVAGPQFGSATIVYELQELVVNDNGDPILDNNNNQQWKYVDSVTATAYNVDPSDIRSAKISKNHDRDLFVIGEDKVAYTDVNDDATDLGKRMRTELTMYGVLDSGMEVRLPSAMVSQFTSTNSYFDVSGKNVTVSNIGNSTTATTTVTGYVYDANRVLTATAAVSANIAAPTPTAVAAKYTNDFLRAAEVDNDIIEVSIDDFGTYIKDRSVLAFTDAKVATTDSNKAGVSFEVNTQYGMANSGLVNRVLVSKVKSGQNSTSQLSIVADGKVNVTNTLIAGDEFKLSAIAANGMTKTITIKILPNPQP